MQDLLSTLVPLGRRLGLPTAPHLSASLDLAIGVGLLAGAALIRWRPRRHHEPRRVALAPGAAYGFGLFSMATNFTTLALVVPAAKDISTDNPGLPGTVAAALALVALACLPAWGPVALVGAAPTTADRVLDWLQRQIEQHGRLVLELIFLAAGLYLLLRGTLELSRL